MMRVVCLLLGAAVASATAGCHAPDTSGPELIRRGNDYELRLPARMRTALKAYDATFRPLSIAAYHPDYVKGYAFSGRQAMFAVIGDFNGDGRRDVMVDGRGRTRSARVALLSDGEAYRAVELEGAPGTGDLRNLDVYLEHVAPGRIESPVCDSSCVLDLRTDAVHVIYDEKGAEILYYLGGKFHTFSTGD